MRCLRLLALNLLIFAIGVLFTSCGDFFTNESSTNGTSTSSNTNTTVTTGTGTTTTGTTGTGTTGTTGTITTTTTGGTATTGTTGIGTTPTTGGTATTGTTGIGTTPTTGGTGTTGTFGTGTTSTGTTGTFGTGTTGTVTGTGTTSTGVGGLFAAVDPRNGRGPGQVPQSSFLYTSAGKGISVGRIDSATGNLTDTHTATGADNEGVVAFMVPDPKGRFLFTSEASASTVRNQHTIGGIDVFAINRTNGTLIPVASGSIVLNQPGQKISIDPTGRFLYAVTDGGIAVYSIDQSSGALSPIPGSPFGTNAASLVVVSPDGKYLYSVGNGNASVYTLDSTTGTPTASGTATSMGAVPESDIAVSPDGKFLFIVDRSTTVKVISIGADGSLTPLAPSPDIGHRNTSIAIHPSGEFVYVANTSDASGSGGVQAFHLDSSGNMTSIGPASSGPSGSPLQIAIDASGKYLYASTIKGVTRLEIDQTTGELTSSSSSLANGIWPTRK